MKKSKTQAFTLIELLVVVLIIGILAAVAVPQYQKAVLRSRLSTLKNLVESIAQSQEAYYLANGTYSSSFENLDVNVPIPLNYSTENASDGSRIGQYLYANYDWGNCFIYRVSDDSSAHVGCRDTLGKIGYSRGLLQSKSFQNKRMCSARNKQAQKVCATETENTPYYSDTTNQIWNYYYKS